MIVRPITVYEPQIRLLSTFLPRLQSLVGPDGGDWIRLLVRPSQDVALREGYDCLIVGVCSTLGFDAELKTSAIQRYGQILPKVQSRVNDAEQAKSLSTLSLIFLLGMEEALVWKVRGDFLLAANGCSNSQQSFRNSQSHVAGWGRIIQSRGPQSFTTAGDVLILRMFRMNAVRD